MGKCIRAIAIRTQIVNPDLVVISINDNGVGMSESILDNGSKDFRLSHVA
ncbi:hypothetical protein [Nostoc sp.]